MRNFLVDYHFFCLLSLSTAKISKFFVVAFQNNFTNDSINIFIMTWKFKLCLLCCIIAHSVSQTTYEDKENEMKQKLFASPEEAIVGEDTLAPTVLIALFVRNKEHALPYFLNTLYNLNYPKDRIALR